MFDFPSSPSTGQIYRPAGTGLPTWQFDGTAWRTLVTSQGVRSPTLTVFTANGSYTPPAGCTAIEVEVLAAGGGGGGGGTSTTASQMCAGGGGGGGGYAKRLFAISEITAPVTVTVGTGGTGGLGSSAGTAGNSSSFGSYVSATGGAGGGCTGIVTVFTPSPSADGGVGSGGQINGAGGAGTHGIAFMTSTSVQAGYGGSTLYGQGGRGFIVTSGLNGIATQGYGGGGGGGVNAVSGTQKNGSNGGNGIVIITEFYTGESPSVRTTADEENLICNPDFIVSQENGSTAITATGYFADQWLGSSVSGGAITWQQFLGVQTPGRATGRMLVTTIDAAVAATDYAGFFQNIEGYVIRDLMWGSAAAKPVVLRFSFYTNVAGTYCACIKSGASDLSYAIPFSHPGSGYVDYTFAIPGPTTGTWAADYTKGMIFSVCGMAGTTYQAPSANAWVAGNYLATSAIGNIMATVNNEMRLGKVGLYADPNNTGIAPPFKIPDFAAELAKCKRYWQNVYGYWSGQITSGSTYTQISYCAVAPRISSPTVSAANSSAANFPTTPGTPSFVGPATIRESRAASATAGAGNFATFFDVSARL